MDSSLSYVTFMISHPYISDCFSPCPDRNGKGKVQGRVMSHGPFTSTITTTINRLHMAQNTFMSIKMSNIVCDRFFWFLQVDENLQEERNSYNRIIIVLML